MWGDFVALRVLQRQERPCKLRRDSLKLSSRKDALGKYISFRFRGGEKGGGVYEQRRVDLATFRAVPASTWDCPQVLSFTIVWDTPGKEKVAKWSSAPASILEGFN